MQFTASQIAALVNGMVEGDPNISVHRLDKIEEAREGSFCFLGNKKYEEHLYTAKPTVVMVAKEFRPSQPVACTLIRVDDVYSSLAKLLAVYEQSTKPAPKVGIDAMSVVSEKASLGEKVYVGAFSVIEANAQIADEVQIFPGCYVGERVKVGKGSILYPGVRIYHGCVVGQNVIVHAGTVIGSDGFGFAPQAEGHFQKIPQTGNVVIEDDVEIGANCTIDRATFGSTRIGKGVKMDNLIQIAHNVEIGEHSVIAAQSGISGSTKLGKHIMMGGQVGTVGHISIADGTKINGQSGIGRSIEEPNTAVTGSPAFDYKSAIKSQVIFRNLPDLEQKVKDLERQLQSLLSAKQ